MKRLLKILLLAAVIAALNITVSAAADTDDYYTEYGFDEAFSAVNDETLALLCELGLNEVSFDSLFNVSLSDAFAVLFNMFTRCVKEPLRFFAVSSVIAALTSVASSFFRNSGTVGSIGTCAAALVAAVPAAQTVNAAVAAMECVAAFSTAFAGAFCAVVSSTGNINAAVSYSVCASAVNVVLSQLGTQFLKTVTGVMCAMAFLSCFDIYALARRAGDVVKKVAVSILGLAGTVFTGVISLKDLLADSLDSVASRSVRFLVGKSVPLVGGVVSESYTAFIAGIKLIKNSVGVFGIAAVALAVLPVLITLGAWSLSFYASVSVCEAFGCRGISSVFSILRDAFTVSIAVIVFGVLIFTVGVGVTLKGGV